MSEVRSYRELKVWQKAMDLVVESYRMSKVLPKSETYALASQMQWGSVSIPANIAEGFGREHLGDYIHHLSIANGSLKELETHALIGLRVSYWTDQECKLLFDLADELGRMLSALIRRLKVRRPTTNT